MKDKTRSIVPKKVFEAWFEVHAAGAKVGHGHLFWEPHADRTAWFQQEWSYVGPAGPVDLRFEARLGLGEWPTLRWCRSRGTERAVELVVAGAAKTPPGARVLPETPRLIPAHLAPLVAATLGGAVGESLDLALLDERAGEIVAGVALVCRGPERIEVAGEAFDTTRFALERGGAAQSTTFVDSNRRIRRIDLAREGVVALLSTKAAAIGEAT